MISIPAEEVIEPMAQDVRWIQRLEHFGQVLRQLHDAQSLADSRSLTKLEEQGMIQAFEYTFGLAWNVLKDFLESRGVAVRNARRHSRSVSTRFAG